MSKKKFNDIQELREVFLAERYILLDQEYKNNRTRMKMICPNGHFISMTGSEGKRGARCEKCVRKGTIITGMKRCNICEKGKSIKKFYARRDRKGGLRPQCIECCEHIAEERYKSNINYTKQKNKEAYNNPMKYNTKGKIRREIEKYEEIRRSKNDNVECKCAYCGEGFEPKSGIIKHRVHAINGEITEGSEIRLYCSDTCKENCPIYHQVKYPKDQKLATSREVQPELRQMVFKRDEYTCQRCSYHRDKLEVGIHCHHMEGLQGNPIESADEDICITLCKDCHREVHNQDGCRYYELRCNKQWP